ncbi:MAG: DegT/DnrJ/EryC1/StrS family aminotransferase [Acidobacteria bacterium]|nr:DegT/DnrJ/EryC1/StrS family aminotransferase [Acidobacteriota bacterium]
MSHPVRSGPLPDEYPGAYCIDAQEEEAVLRILRSRSLYRYYGCDPQGEVSRFEQEFAAYIGVRHAVAVTSGTAALHVALGALGIGPGQEVIVPAFLWISVAAAVVNLGAIPVLADIDESFCLTADSVRRVLSSRTAAIIAVHMSGAPADIVPLVALAREANVFLVEDCAQCMGGSVHGQSVGSFGHIATFSFQVNKNISCGEGGAVVTNDQALHQRLIAIHDIGLGRDATGRVLLDNESSWSWGRGYRMDELRAAILRVQLRKLPGTLAHLRTSKQRILQTLHSLPQLAFRRHADPAGDTGSFLITVLPSDHAARAIHQRLCWHNINVPSGNGNVLLSEYGLHIYSNIPVLTHQIAVDRRLFPWRIVENAGTSQKYCYGTCPYADGLFSRSLLLAVPCGLTLQDEQDIIAAFSDSVSFI